MQRLMIMKWASIETGVVLLLREAFRTELSSNNFVQMMCSIAQKNLNHDRPILYMAMSLYDIITATYEMSHKE